MVLMNFAKPNRVVFASKPYQTVTNPSTCYYVLVTVDLVLLLLQGHYFRSCSDWSDWSAGTNDLYGYSGHLIAEA